MFAGRDAVPAAQKGDPAPDNPFAASHVLAAGDVILADSSDVVISTAAILPVSASGESSGSSRDNPLDFSAEDSELDREIVTEPSEWWSKNFILGGYKGAWGV